MVEQRLKELKSILNYQLKQTIKNVNNEFTKAPIDSGLMLKTTQLVSVTLDLNNLDISLDIKSQEYLKYVENGWGSNRKYGKRKVREVAISHPDVQNAIEKLYSALIEENIVSKLKNENIRRTIIRV